MPGLTELTSYKRLLSHHESIQRRSILSFFEADRSRFATLSRRIDLGPSGELLVDFSKHRVLPATIDLLIGVAQEAGLIERRDRMFAGEPINTTEERAVLHMALRAPRSAGYRALGESVTEEVLAALEHIQDKSEKVRNGTHTGYTGRKIEQVVNIGIGGSDLGPLMVSEALLPYQDGPKLHFVSNVDSSHLAGVLRACDPETTLFLIASKTFTTQETLENAKSARVWFLSRAKDETHIQKHFFALSTNEAEVKAFGIDPANMFVFWNWVGGRYSLWSSVGLSIAMGIGYRGFQELLDGANRVDEHFRTAELKDNLPALLGLLGVYNQNVLGASAHAVLPYDQHLHRLPAYLQQADMESNGKSVRLGGQPCGYGTGVPLFGEPGTNGQHAFYQLLHQGTQLVPCDFLVAAHGPHELGSHHRLLLSNVVAQAEALMRGKSKSEVQKELAAQGIVGDAAERLAPHKVFGGDRPSTLFLYDRLDPRTLGALIALYEHRVFVMGTLWDINSFDQWGVELGKQLATKIAAELVPGAPCGAHDGSTEALIQELRKRRADKP